MTDVPSITVTSHDLERLQRVLAFKETDAVEQLDAELARANVVPPDQIGSDVVTMNSDVVYEDLASGIRRVVRVVYPEDADPERGWVSVLAPLGAALLGMRVGQEIAWNMPRGVRRVRVLAVPYQPEASGDAL